MNTNNPDILFFVLSLIHILKRRKAETWKLQNSWRPYGKDIGHADFYVGEIFQGSYADVYLYLKKVAERFGSRAVSYTHLMYWNALFTNLLTYEKNIFSYCIGCIGNDSC